MNLYIETENGQVKNHPAYETNLFQAFGQIPEHWEPFVRVEEPALEPGKVFDSPSVTYEKVNGVWTDVYHVRDMTAEEKEAERQTKIEAFKSVWAAQSQVENW